MLGDYGAYDIMISSTKQSSIRLALDQTALGIVDSIDILRGLLTAALGAATLPDGYKNVLREMEAPNQKNCTPLVDQLLIVLQISRINNTKYTNDIQETIDTWLDFTFAYFRLSALTVRHAVDHVDTKLRRDRLAHVARHMRGGADTSTRLRALSVYRKFRYKRVIESIPESGDTQLFMDPTVSINYIRHARVGRPMLSTLIYHTIPPMDDISKGHVTDFIQLKSRLRRLGRDESNKKIQEWMDARGLREKPSIFKYNKQLSSLDAFVHLHDGGDLANYRRLSTGKFQDDGSMHPLATFWKPPLGRREKISWHLWWKHG